MNYVTFYFFHFFVTMYIFVFYFIFCYHIQWLKLYTYHNNVNVKPHRAQSRCFCWRETAVMPSQIRYLGSTTFPFPLLSPSSWSFPPFSFCRKAPPVGTVRGEPADIDFGGFWERKTHLTHLTAIIIWIFVMAGLTNKHGTHVRRAPGWKGAPERHAAKILSYVRYSLARPSKASAGPLTRV